MILNNENKEASRYLSKFAHLIRITLNQSTQSLVSLRNTIDYLQRYMEMENIRNSLFSFVITRDEELDPDEVLIPPMLIQPFIENALWHGVSANNKSIHIRVSFKKVKETLVCTIDDNGIGINQSQKNRADNTGRHLSHGIANIRNRVELLNEKYNLHGRFTIGDKKDICGETGTLVTLHLPIEIKEI
jgi:sensor histidine kinase YesM